MDLDELIHTRRTEKAFAPEPVPPAVLDELFELARFVGCTRPGFEMDSSRLGDIPPDRVRIVEVPALAISSTDCRERTAAGEPVWYLVPDGVVQYISKHHLYEPANDVTGQPTEQGAV